MARPVEAGNELDMVRLRKEVERGPVSQAISGIDELSRIPGERGRITVGGC